MKKSVIIVLVCLTGCLFFESLEREGFTVKELITPVLYREQIMQIKPVENYFLPLSYQYNISWETMDLYARYMSAFNINIENTGTHKLFVYGFGIKIDGEEQKTNLGGGKEILSGEDEDFIFSFICPSKEGNYSYMLGVYFMSGIGNKWHDYGLKYLGKEKELTIIRYENAGYKLVNNYYRYFDRINELVDPYAPTITQQVTSITLKYGQTYNTAKICALFEWIYTNIEYINDTEDEWNDPCDALDNGGDCEEFAMLMASMVARPR